MTPRGTVTPAVQYNVVLGGGAQLGAVQAGQLRALAEHGVEIGALYGCSVGALNGAWVAGGFTVERCDALIEMWREAGNHALFDRGLRRAVAVVRKGAGLSRPDGVRELVERAIPATALEAFPIPLEVVTCDLTNGVAAYHRSGDAASIITASCAMPGMLPPVEIDGARHVDGGVLDVLPWRRAVGNGGPVLVLDCRSARPWEGSGENHALGVLLESFALARHHRAYDGITTEPRVRIVPGATVGRGHTLRDAPALIEASLEATRSWLAGGGLDPRPTDPIDPVDTSTWVTRLRSRRGAMR